MTERILRRNEVENITGLKRSTIYLAIKENRFPPPIKLTERTVGWPESVISEWIESKKNPSSTTEQI